MNTKELPDFVHKSKIYECEYRKCPIRRPGERLLRPEMAEKRTKCKVAKPPIIAHFYQCFNNDCVTYPFQS